MEVKLEEERLAKEAEHAAEQARIEAEEAAQAEAKAAEIAAMEAKIAAEHAAKEAAAEAEEASRAAALVPPPSPKIVEEQREAPVVEKPQKMASLAEAAVAVPGQSADAMFSYDDIAGVGRVVQGVDPSNREMYLRDDEFTKLFGMDKSAFSALPQWKRVAAKKKHKLF
ncbi:unnamed protein product [Chrysoparadoxa australica]